MMNTERNANTPISSWSPTFSPKNIVGVDFLSTSEEVGGPFWGRQKHDMFQVTENVHRREIYMLEKSNTQQITSKKLLKNPKVMKSWLVVSIHFKNIS